MLHAGSVLLALTADKAGLSRGLSAALAPWRKPMAVHDPGKVLLDLAISLAIGGDCLAHVAQLRAEPAVFGHVASDPTVSRLIDTLAADAPAALKAIDAPRAGARARVWKLAGPAAPNHDRSAKAPLVVDVDATLVTAHSEKQLAKATFKRASDSTRSAPGSPTAPAASGNPWRCCCGRGTQDRTPRLTTSAWSRPLSRNCPAPWRTAGPAAVC